MPSNPWIQTYHPHPHARLNLFCFPYAGGSAQAYRDWGKKMPDWVEVRALQYPGRWNRHSEPLLRDHVSLAETIYSGLRGETETPFALFGHSMGGMLAYEFCRRLQDRLGAKPVLLAVSAVEAPQAYRGPKSASFDLSDEALIQRIRALGGAPKEVIDHPQMLRALLPILRADLQVIENYSWEAGEKLECPVLALAGKEDAEVAMKKMEPWREQTKVNFRMERFSGGHFFPKDQEDTVIAVIRQEMETYL